MNGSREKKIYMAGIKGTGMSSLAVHLTLAGATVSGWDSGEVFPTDTYLTAYGIRTDTDETLFDPSLWDTLVYSGAIDTSHPLVSRAVSAGLEVYSYHAYLGKLSRTSRVIAVAGTHGKTTASGCADHILQSLDIPHGSIYGSQPIGDERHTAAGAETLLVLEACEYRNHFHSYAIDTLLITNVEWEHADFFTQAENVVESFVQLVSLLPPSATLIISLSTEGAREVARRARSERSDLQLVTYGKEEGEIRYSYPLGTAVDKFSIEGIASSFKSQLVGEGFIEDLIGAALSVACETKRDLEEVLFHACSFRGCRGRVEKLDSPEVSWTLYNDYAHHPSEIRHSLSSLRMLHDSSRIIVAFYPHTLSRMKTFYQEFVEVLSESDLLFIAPVALSARKDGTEEEAEELSQNLCRETGGVFAESDEKMKALLLSVLHRGDVCVTMGAGNTQGIRTLLTQDGT